MKISKASLLIACTAILILAITCFIFGALLNKQVFEDETLKFESERIIYLTFDDGPSVLTDKILDILKTNDVKATFFVIGNQIKGFESTMKRIYDEGHSIGLHTYTHDFKKIYSNRDRFISEMQKTQKEINAVTGVESKIIRFPGGSWKRLTKTYLDELHGLGYKVYDWNALVSDGVNNNTSAEKLFQEATKTSVSECPIILLMHCDYMHKNTCKALPRIISFYKERGYEFKIITEETPEYYFPIEK